MNNGIEIAFREVSKKREQIEAEFKENVKDIRQRMEELEKSIDKLETSKFSMENVLATLKRNISSKIDDLEREKNELTRLRKQLKEKENSKKHKFDEAQREFERLILQDNSILAKMKDEIDLFKLKITCKVCNELASEDNPVCKGCKNNHQTCQKCLKQYGFCTICRQPSKTGVIKNLKGLSLKVNQMENVFKSCNTLLENSKRLFSTKKNKILSFEFGNKLSVKEETKQREGNNFCFWLRRTEVRVKLEENVWNISFYEDEFNLGEFKVSEGHPNCDTFFRFEDSIYLFVNLSLTVYKITVSKGKGKVVELGRTTDSVCCMVEIQDNLVVGTFDSKVLRINGETPEKLLDTSATPSDLVVEGNTLWIADWNGQITCLNIPSKTVERRFKTEPNYSFFSGANSVVRHKNKLSVFNPGGVKIAEIAHSISSNSYIAYNDSNYAVLASSTKLLLFDHLTFKTVEKKVEIPSFYIHAS